jgi:hypothetical protein
MSEPQPPAPEPQQTPAVPPPAPEPHQTPAVPPPAPAAEYAPAPEFAPAPEYAPPTTDATVPSAPVVPGVPAATPVGARPSRGPWVPLLAGFTALFFVLSVALGVLFFLASTELTEQRATIASQKAQLKEKDAKIVGVEGERDKARQELDTSKDSVSSLTADKATIAQCLKGVLEMFDILAEGTEAQFDAVAKRIEAPCTRAEGLIS